MNYNITIAGSRGFNNYAFLSREVSKIISNHNINVNDVVIISGGAKGADKLGERYAMDNNMSLDLHPADWSKGRYAGMIRNREMANISQMVIIFWDGMSTGSKGMYDICIEKNINTFLYEMPKTVLGRLERARKYIEEAVSTLNYENLLKYTKNFKELYAECFSMWADNNFNDLLEYSEAEYLKYLITYSFGEILDYNNSLSSLRQMAISNAKDCNIKSIL